MNNEIINVDAGAFRPAKLSAALVAAEAEMTPVVKDADNPFFKSEYATLKALTAMLRPILARHGLAFVQFVRVTDGREEMVTRIIHSSGEAVESAVPFACADKKPQGYGSAITYFRRYGIQAAFGIVVADGSDDDGNVANGNRTPAPAARPVARPAPKSAPKFDANDVPF